MTTELDPYPICPAGQLRKKRCFPCMCLPEHVAQGLDEKKNPCLISNISADQSKEVPIISTEHMIETVRHKLQVIADKEHHEFEDILLLADLAFIPIALWKCIHSFSDRLFIVIRLEGINTNGSAVFKIIIDRWED